MYFAAFAAALALVGCSKTDLESETTSPAEDGGTVELTVNVTDSMMETKVTGSNNDKKVNSLQVFVFNKHGILETSADAATSEVTLSCTAGQKHVVALVNAQTESGVTTLADLSARKAGLETTTSTNCVMVGEADHNVTKSGGLSITVKRLTSMVGLKSVELAFQSAYLRTLPFEIKAVYLINVAGERDYISNSTPSVWYNQGGYNETTCLGILYDPVSNGAITSGGEKYETDHYFYCYPNTTSTPTRLVIEATIDSQTYYYPIEVKDIQPNNKYMYDVKIKGLGKDSPDIMLTSSDMKNLVTVDIWVDNAYSVDL